MAASFTSLYRDYLAPMTAGPILEEVYRLTSDPNSDSIKIADAVEKNAAYAHLLRKLDILKSRSGPENALSQILGLIGRQATRNIIASIRITRATGGQLPRNAKDPMKATPREKLKYALAAEDFCLNHSLPYSEKAWAAGLHFDWLAALLEARNQKPLKAALDEAWREALVIAKIAHGIGTLLKRFPKDDLAFASGLMIGMGKSLMAVTYPKPGKPAWPELVAEAEKLGQSAPEIFRIREKKAFQVQHANVASVCAIHMGLIPGAGRALLHYQEPYLLKKDAPEDYILSLVLHLSALGAARKKLSTQSEAWMVKDLKVSKANYEIAAGKGRK